MPSLHPCPLCPECGRVLDEREAAQTECVGACCECVLDAAEDAVLSGKLWAHEEGTIDAH